MLGFLACGLLPIVAIAVANYITAKSGTHLIESHARNDLQQIAVHHVLLL